MFPFRFCSTLEGVLFVFGGFVHFVVDVEGGFGEDLEEGFAVIGDGAEGTVGLVVEGLVGE